MNEKVRFRDNEKLLKKLSLINSIVILVMRVLIIVNLFIAKYGPYQSVMENEEEEGSFMMAGIVGFLLALFFLFVVIFVAKAIFSVITIVVGVTSNYKKTYSTLSIITAIFTSMIALTFVSAFFDGLKTGFNILSLIAAIVLVAFCVYNDIVQWFLYEINQKHIKPIKESNDIDSNNMNTFL